jgi:two-component system, NtrC family, sensor kinase
MSNEGEEELLTKIATLQHELAQVAGERDEALAQQTASADILKAISSSPAELKSILEAIVDRTKRLGEAAFACVGLFEGKALRFAAISGSFGESDFFDPERLHPPDGCPYVGPLAHATKAVQTTNLRTERGYIERDPFYTTIADVGRARTALRVPLLKDGKVLGHLWAFRCEVRLFSDKQIALVRTFADQAAIAIENVRLLGETQEALEQQTATSEILRAISGSPIALEPVLEAVVGAAARFCGASDVLLLRVERNVLRGASGVGQFAEIVKTREGSIAAIQIPIDRGSISGRAVSEQRTVHVHDLAAESEHEYPLGRQLQRRFGHRTCVATPLLREGVPLGVIALFRMEVHPFSEKQIVLLQTFADQAVIAIENVRLFNETKDALERQTATSEILRVISQSPRDVRPVFDSICKSAVRVCEARYGAVFRVDRDLVHLMAHHNFNETSLALLQSNYPMAPDLGHVSGRAIIAGAPIQVPDILDDREYLGSGPMKTAGFRSLLGVPLVRDGRAVGAIVIYRAEPGHFENKHVELLKTFADQAVIAIENVRLFTELETRTNQLTRSVEELKALGEVGRAVSSTLDLETVLSTIVSRASALVGVDAGAIYEFDDADQKFHLHTADRLPDEIVTALRAEPVRKGEGALGQMAMTGEPAQIRDIMGDDSYQSRLREVVLGMGYRSLMAVPLLREEHLLGGLVVYRHHAGEFAQSVIDVLKTFATQSALAIQNARLYREIEVKSREIEVASRHKSEFLANMSHELRTPLNAIIGFSEVLSERMFGEINEKQAEYVADILESGQHLLSLINDILDLSKIEAGRMELELTEFELPTAIENALTLVKERAHRRAIVLACAVDERVGIMRGDERKVKQVLLNLLSNALKFTPDGGQVDVRARMHNGETEISVTDTGVGIAPEDQKTVFDEFRQVGTASKRVEGTGLGLAISRKFIELHGGRIWVKSQVGQGSTFTFTLPLTKDRRHKGLLGDVPAHQ